MIETTEIAPGLFEAVHPTDGRATRHGSTSQIARSRCEEAARGWAEWDAYSAANADVIGRIVTVAVVDDRDIFPVQRTITGPVSVAEGPDGRLGLIVSCPETGDCAAFDSV